MHVDFEKFLEVHKIDIYKDVIIPSLGLDKIVALIALIYGVKTYISTYKLAKLNFSYQITLAHRDIWSKTFNSPELEKINDPDADVTNITKDQQRIIVFILLNNEISYEAYLKGVHDYTIASQRDTGEFMNLPIPNAVWERAKEYYEPDFAAFIDQCKTLATLRNYRPNTISARFKKRLRRYFRRLFLRLAKALA